MPTLERASRLAASPDAVWARVTSADGVNEELMPWLRMTVPAGWTGTSIADVEPGAFLGRSWILLLCVVPFDFDDLTDRITFESRFGALAGVHATILRAVFAHRHARLRRRFGHRATGGSGR